MQKETPNNLLTKHSKDRRKRLIIVLVLMSCRLFHILMTSSRNAQDFYTRRITLHIRAFLLVSSSEPCLDHRIKLNVFFISCPNAINVKFFFNLTHSGENKIWEYTITLHVTYLQRIPWWKILTKKILFKVSQTFDSQKSTLLKI